MLIARPLLAALAAATALAGVAPAHAAPAAATLNLAVLPGGANVDISPGRVEQRDGGWVVHDLAVGDVVTVKARRTGYYSHKEKIRIERREMHRVIFMEVDKAARKTGQLKISSRPAGAKVFLDSKLLGLTPLIAEVVAGRLTLHIQRAGYRTHKLSVEVKPGETASVVTTLKKKRLGP